VLPLPDMPVVTLSGLVVVPEDASSIDDQRQPVLEIVPATRSSRTEAPHDEFHEGVHGDDMTLVEQQDGLHVVDRTNTRGDGQPEVVYSETTVRVRFFGTQPDGGMGEEWSPDLSGSSPVLFAPRRDWLFVVPEIVDWP
jgi:hypothetical protein